MWVTLVLFCVSVSLSTPLHPICHAPLSERSLLPPACSPLPSGASISPSTSLQLCLCHYEATAGQFSCLLPSLAQCYLRSLTDVQGPSAPSTYPLPLSITSLTSAISLAVLCPLVSVLSPRTDCSSWSRDISYRPLSPETALRLLMRCVRLFYVFFTCVLIHCSLVGDAEHVWLSPDEEQH